MTALEWSRKAPRMLIADDDPAIVRLLADRCASVGFDVETAANGIQATGTGNIAVTGTGGNDRGVTVETERQSRFVLIVKVPDKQTENVVTALIKAVRKLPVSLRRSLTWDRGTELANHAQFTVATDVQVYFCDPSSPWQRGSNENTNGLLRQYYPKGMDLSGVSQARLDTVARKLNTRPRETLHWKTPAYMLRTTVSMTH